MARQLFEYSEAVGLRTYTQCINPEKLRLLTRTNGEFTLDTGERPRVVVVGDAGGSDPITGAKGPCLDYSPGGTCVKRTRSDRPKVHTLPSPLLSSPLSPAQLGRLFGLTREWLLPRADDDV